MSDEQDVSDFQEEDYDEFGQNYVQINDDISEVTNGIKQTTEEIVSSYESIFSILKEIQEIKSRYTILESTIRSLRTAPIALDGSGKSTSLSSRSQSNEGQQIMHTHQLKINGKKADINNIKNEIDQNQRKTFQSLDERFKALLDDEKESEINLVNAQTDINDYKINSERNRLRIQFYQDQIKERKEELRLLRILKADASKSLGILTERESQCMSSDAPKSMGILMDKENQCKFADDQAEYKNSISNLKCELLKIETETQKVRNRIFNFKENADNELFEFQYAKDENQRAANWEEEKRSLTETLKDLKEKVRALKQHQVFYPSEVDKSASLGEVKSDAMSAEERDMYGSIVRKYSNSVINKNVPLSDSGSFKGSAAFNSSGGLNSSNRKIADNFEKIMEPRIKLAKLMEENAKNEKLLAKKKELFQLIVGKFRKMEKDIIDNTPKIIAEYQEKERKLIEKIRKIKIKQAQERLNNEKK